MWKGIVGSCLISILLATPAGSQEPKSPLLAPDQSEAARALYCLGVKESLSKWTNMLRMQDWAIQPYCADVPPWETKEDAAGLRGSSITNAAAKTIAIWVHQGDPDPEHVAIHELLHGVINYSISAQSKIVEENVVGALADILDAYDDALRVHENTEKKLVKALERGAIR